MSSTKSSGFQWTISIICLAVLALLFGLWARHNMSESKDVNLELASATILDQPRNLSAFKLTDDDNQPFTLDNFKGHWSLVFFGFTHCPDLCPTTLATLSKSYKDLALTQKEMPNVVFISVDPEQDNAKRIKDYLKSFNISFLGATGEEKQLNQLTQEFNVVYGKVQATNSEHYTIDHSGTILIINPQGQFYGVFTLPHDAQKIAQDMKIIMTSGATLAHND